MAIKLLQIGPPKCGNYWLYNIIRQVYRLRGIPYRSYISTLPVYQEAQQWPLSHSLQAGIDMMDIARGKCFYRISSAFRNPITNLDEYLSHTNHVWTHSEVGEHILPVLERFTHRVYIYRDPRDMAVSAARYAFTPYMLRYYPHHEKSPESYLNNHLHDIIHNWVWHVTDYLLLKDRVPIHFMSYERLLGDFEGSLQRLSDYLGLPLRGDEMEKVARRVDFRKLQARDPGHVRKGKSGQWVEVLSRGQVQRVSEMAGPLLKLLGYGQESNHRMPADANTLRPDQVQQVAQALGKVPGIRDQASGVGGPIAGREIYPVHGMMQTRREKEQHLKQQARVIWFTGLSGAGKTLIASLLEQELVKEGYFCQVLDGDNIRSGLNRNLGFSEEDRQENIRRIAEVAKLFMQCGVITLCAFISPTRQMRRLARSIIGGADFLEVYVGTPLEVCEQRDPKGLYKKARAGDIPQFTGITAPYEPPQAPFIMVNTHLTEPHDAAGQILQKLLPLIRRGGDRE